jgi:DUF971 family protein
VSPARDPPRALARCLFDGDRMSEGAAAPWPTELRLHKDRKVLTVAFDSAESFDLPAEYLRVKSPSAEVQGHSASERKTVAGKKNVLILELHPIGNYAVRIVFDDLHSTGIYSWDYLHALGRERASLWQDYLDELAAKGLAR